MKRLIFHLFFSFLRIIVHFHHGKAAYLVADHASFEVKRIGSNLVFPTV